MKTKLLIIMMFAVAVGGCDQIDSLVLKTTKSKRDVKKVEKKIESADLAKIILKPKKRKMTVQKDPFKPILYQSHHSTAKKKSRKFHDASSIKDFKFVGVVKVNNEYLALLKKGNERGIFRKNDKVKNFTVTRIKDDRVILSNGIQTITLKRGSE